MSIETIKRRCPTCKGTGKCQNCDGTGVITVNFPVVCERCKGTGECKTCRGTGEVSMIRIKPE